MTKESGAGDVTAVVRVVVLTHVTAVVATTRWSCTAGNSPQALVVERVAGIELAGVDELQSTGTSLAFVAAVGDCSRTASPPHIVVCSVCRVSSAGAAVDTSTMGGPVEDSRGPDDDDGRSTKHDPSLTGATFRSSGCTGSCTGAPTVGAAS